MKGYANSIARVNLFSGEIRFEAIKEKWARDFIGGRGYGGRIIYEEVDPLSDPLGASNKIVVATGPVAGSGSPASGRTMIVTKSPLNGTLACSNVGGFFGDELKKAGYDMVIIEGKSAVPVYLWINEGNIEIKKANHIWGKKVSEVEPVIRQETNDKVRIMAIGPAGVNLSKISGVMFDLHRAAGRTGVGAVLGSKNLLGIAVRGTKKVEFADKAALRQASANARELLKEAPITSQGLPTYGTAVLVNIINEAGGYPTRNAQESYYPTAGKTGGESIAEQTLIKKGACSACPIACGRITEIREGPYAGQCGEGPEYETTWSLGAMCDVDDLNAITCANYICNEYGLDTISAGVTIACAMELCERGYVPPEDLPFDVRFGDGDTVVRLVEIMGNREGTLGHWLAEGSYRLAEHYGHPELSMTTKKQEMPAYDPRAFKGIGLNYATSNRGACHVRGYTIAMEALSWPAVADRLTYDGKAGMVKTFQDFTAVVDSAGICLFTFFGMPNMSDYSPILRAVTGINYSDEELLKAGERIFNLERLWNLKAGFKPVDDTLPTRLLSEPVPEGPSKGEVCELNKILPEYYTLRGWDQDGKPTEVKLKELDLRS